MIPKRPVPAHISKNTVFSSTVINPLMKLIKFIAKLGCDWKNPPIGTLKLNSPIFSIKWFWVPKIKTSFLTLWGMTLEIPLCYSKMKEISVKSPKFNSLTESFNSWIKSDSSSGENFTTILIIIYFVCSDYLINKYLKCPCWFS